MILASCPWQGNFACHPTSDGPTPSSVQASSNAQRSVATTTQGNHQLTNYEGLMHFQSQWLCMTCDDVLHQILIFFASKVTTEVDALLVRRIRAKAKMSHPAEHLHCQQDRRPGDSLPGQADRRITFRKDQQSLVGVENSRSLPSRQVLRWICLTCMLQLDLSILFTRIHWSRSEFTHAVCGCTVVQLELNRCTNYTNLVHGSFISLQTTGWWWQFFPLCSCMFEFRTCLRTFCQENSVSY